MGGVLWPWKLKYNKILAHFCAQNFLKKPPGHILEPVLGAGDVHGHNQNTAKVPLSKVLNPQPLKQGRGMSWCHERCALTSPLCSLDDTLPAEPVVKKKTTLQQYNLD